MKLKSFISKYWMCILFTIFIYLFVILDSHHIPYDFEYYHYPLLSHLYNSIHNGFFPLWNAFNYGGQSFIANPQVGSFFPFTYIPLIMSLFNNNEVTKYMCEYIIIFSFGLGLCGFYRLFIRLKYNKLLSFLGSVLIMTGGYMISQYQHLGVIEIISLLPFAFYIWINIIKGEGKNNWIKLAIIDSLIIFTGFLPYALNYFMIEALIIFIFSKDKKKIIICDIKYYLFVACLTCVLLLPVALNAGVSKDLTVKPGFDFKNLLSLFEPNILNVKYGDYIGSNHITVDNLWTGILFPIFILYGLYSVIRKEENSKKWLILSLYFLCFFLTYRPISGYIAKLFSYIPGVGVLYRAGNFLLFLHIASVFFVLYGIKTFLKDKRSLVLNIITLLCITISSYYFLISDSYSLRGIIFISSLVICFILLLIQIHNKISVRKIELFIIVSFVIQILLFQYNIDFYSSKGTSKGYEDYINSELFNVFKNDNSKYRVFAQQSSCGAEWESAWPTWKIESLNGYDPTISYKLVEYLSVFADYDQRGFNISNPNSEKLQFLNVKYVVANSNVDIFEGNDNFELVKDEFYRIYKYKKFTERYIVINNHDLTNKSISIDELNNGTQVKATINKEKTIIDIVGNDKDVLFISEQFNKDWHATINGKNVDLINVNDIFMAVPLEAGANHIEIYYRPLSYVIGLIISVVSWISIALYYIIKYIQKNNKKNKKHTII